MNSEKNAIKFFAWIDQTETVHLGSMFSAKLFDFLINFWTANLHSKFVQLPAELFKYWSYFERLYLKLEAITSPILDRHSSIRGIPKIA